VTNDGKTTNGHLPAQVEADPRDVPAPYPSAQDYINRLVNAGIIAGG
jgi:hypothetical protein